MKTLINIDVPDLGEAINFYCKAFEFKLNRILDDDVAELTRGGSTIYLLQKEVGSTCCSHASGARSYERHWTPLHLDFVVRDLVGSTQRVLAAGATQESECVDWRGSKCVSFADPFGHGFCLIQFDGESYSENE